MNEVNSITICIITIRYSSKHQFMSFILIAVSMNPRQQDRIICLLCINRRCSGRRSDTFLIPILASYKVADKFCSAQLHAFLIHFFAAFHQKTDPVFQIFQIIRFLCP